MISIETVLKDKLVEGLQEALNNIKEEIIVEAREKFVRESKRLIGQAAVDLASYFTVERIGTDLLIQVKFEEGK